MDKKAIIEKARLVSENEAKKLELEIVEVDYVFENGIKILRVIADGENGLDVDDASELNRLISDALDLIPEKDFITEEYYLEVSSVGIEKELKTDSDILENVGKYVYVKTYEKVEGIKEVYGDLVSFEDGVVTINYLVKTVRKQVKIQKDKISKIRLAVRF